MNGGHLGKGTWNDEDVWNIDIWSKLAAASKSTRLNAVLDGLDTVHGGYTWKCH
jgi:hypothetical protein